MYNSAICLICNTLANPICNCGALAISFLDSNIILYVNDITKVKLVTLHYFTDGDVAHVTQGTSLKNVPVRILP